MEKTYKYTTLKGLIKRNRQFSLSTYLNKRMCHITKGWGKFYLSAALDQEIRSLFCDLLGDVSFDSSKNRGILGWVVIEKRDLKAHYIASQDYSQELRYIRRLLKWI